MRILLRGLDGKVFLRRKVHSLLTKLFIYSKVHLDTQLLRRAE